MSTPPPSAANPQTPEPRRKFPAPCWIQEETLALINVYQDKWYSLRRRNLRSTDWDEVAAAVASRCPDQTPSKTSAQCRHKMEKLRKRYRTEKQRALSFPTRFFSSSWIFYDLMDAMETGSSLGDGSEPDPSVQKGFSAKVGDLEEREFQLGRMDESFKGKISTFNGDLGSSFNGVDVLVGGSSGKKPPLPIKFKFKNQGSTLDFDSNMEDHDDDDNDDDELVQTGFHVQTRSYDRYMNSKEPNYGSVDGNVHSLHGKTSTRKLGKSDESSGSGFLNGFCKKSGGGGLKRGMNSVAAEMVASIKMLGNGFVKMENTKMEMVREIERMKMEMEMKRIEMILESQQLIVNAFVEGWLEKKRRKVKATATDIKE
ncbi:hypothetical protein Nepgr_011125 [Nepenthes gracilis]|uniref:Myb-like domain-containing protein n=1 Tax=Nepenthes gracilis TaxID=150966 RepID=A0AAD3XM00_NEPGR|nr:hypothetical protein Nepgr_011125 [Nepenthes gracilis]